MSSLVLRPAVREDMALLHRWRNDPQTRAASRDGRAIDWDEHERWFLAALASPDRRIVIAEQNGNPVGVLRADRSGRGRELSWTVAPEARGQGIGSVMLAMFVRTLEGPLYAAIKADNAASAKVAAAAGLLRSPRTDGDYVIWTRD